MLFRVEVVNIVDEIISRAAMGRVAVMTEEESWTYGELLERVSRVADWLGKVPGFQREGGGIARVGLGCRNGMDYVVLALGILKAGACLVPVADELTEAERADLLQRTGVTGLLIGATTNWRREDGGALHPETGARWLAREGERLAEETEFAALEPAFVRFSSGTTGRSKGVVLAHRSLRERVVAANAALEIGPGDRVLWLLPMAHHFAVSIVLYLYHGACTVIGNSHVGGDILRTAEQTKATVIYGAPFHYSLLAADPGDFRWPGLRLAVSTAAPLDAGLAGAFRKRFDRPLVQGLGIIEVGLPLLNTGGAGDCPTAVGRPLPAYDVELRNEEGMPVAAGQVGELWIKGPGMMDAYLSPWQPISEICVDGWFATGDLAETDAAGRIYLRGRRKSVLNVNGMKVFPEEVEQVMERHPAVKRCHVKGAQHPVLGTVPVADVMVKEGATLTVRELKAWCRSVLSVYKVPVAVTFVEQLPMTASGKIRRA